MFQLFGDEKKIESENLPSLKLTPIMSFANLYTRIKFVILCGKEEKQKLTVMIIKVLKSNTVFPHVIVSALEYLPPDLNKK